MEIIDILACPKCKGELELKDNWLICNSCKLKYPIVDGIPLLVVDDAKPLEG